MLGYRVGFAGAGASLDEYRVVLVKELLCKTIANVGSVEGDLLDRFDVLGDGVVGLPLVYELPL